MPAHYILDESYTSMIDALAVAHEAHDPMSHIREVVGEYAGVWPENVLEDDNAETSIEEQFAAAVLDLGDLVAPDPRYHDPAARLDLVMKIIGSVSDLSPEAQQSIRSRIADYYATQAEALQVGALECEAARAEAADRRGLSPMMAAMLLRASAKIEIAEARTEHRRA